jgi:ketosteroid isomerase-like protein
MRSPPGSHMLCGQEAKQLMQAEDEVRAASVKFYAALNRMLNGDPGSLTDIWSHGASVTAMHPIGGREIGWDQVRKSFEQVAKLTSAGQVRLSDQIIQVAGDVAYELGVERAR